MHIGGRIIDSTCVQQFVYQKDWELYKWMNYLYYFAWNLWAARNRFPTNVAPSRSCCFCWRYPPNVLLGSRKRKGTWVAHCSRRIPRLRIFYSNKLSDEKPHSWWYCVQNLNFNASLNSRQPSYLVSISEMILWELNVHNSWGLRCYLANVSNVKESNFHSCLKSYSNGKRSKRMAFTIA